ncbi:hypothetical protein PSU4_22610 [Pseudonocardia sulfidoxydans NBRC 16205]|uniref:Uncharacterized protein n=1 Tax=Pseudonocardia sulfidoxydans NBRC 16205 TaxID=1223511 RepID=A0A511DFK7_9PSEU|nr:hypothetical protein [Pseudonocardia sulfidoxydans]GEL23307.1 hypothetical protein PSU4_22610 [Pseudonocardia sulfidoxydans NBRC 16205]
MGEPRTPQPPEPGPPAVGEGRTVDMSKQGSGPVHDDERTPVPHGVWYHPGAPGQPGQQQGYPPPPGWGSPPQPQSLQPPSLQPPSLQQQSPQLQPSQQQPPQQQPLSGGVWAWLRARGWRLAIGVGIAGAAVLLIPFFLFPTLDPDRPVHQWWPPFAIGLGTLVLLSILRLDRLLKGWTWHVAGIAFVGALVVFTKENPWAWALALSLALLLAGLLRLPRWQLSAAGAVLCALSIVGFSITASHVTQAQLQEEIQAGNEVRATVGGVPNAQEVPPLLDRVISGRVADPQPLCRIVGPAAETQLTAATGTADCAAAVAAVWQKRESAGGPAPVTSVRSDAAPMTSEPTYTLSTCGSAWAAAAGAQLGRVTVAWTDDNARRYSVTGFQSC